MCLQDTVRIPLRARDGSIRAYALVDAADAEFVNRWHWSLGSNGYVHRGEYKKGRQRTFRLHREILGLVHGDGLVGDHINRNRLDNRRANLRKVSGDGNSQNQSARPGRSSRFRGVTWRKNDQKWAAQIQINGKHIGLGLYRTEEQAAEAARLGRLRLMPYAVD